MLTGGLKEVLYFLGVTVLKIFFSVLACRMLDMEQKEKRRGDIFDLGRSSSAVIYVKWGFRNAGGQELPMSYTG